MFIDFVDVENFAKQHGVLNNFSVNKFNKRFGRVGQSFWDRGSMLLHVAPRTDVENMSFEEVGLPA